MALGRVVCRALPGTRDWIMTAQWDASTLRELYRRKETFPLDADVFAQITPSTLSAETLQFLGMLVRWKRPCHIFEFGSGLSTSFLARLQGALGVASSPALTSVDHSPRYLAETRRTLGAAANVSLLHAPLVLASYLGRVFTTYDPGYTLQLQPDIRFDFVLIDGPPAYRYGREAPLYSLAPYLATGAMIVLDDANREPEQAALRNWRAAWPDGFVAEIFPDLKKGLAVCRIGDAAHRTAPCA